ncbi:MAG: helix-turn-helix transcriptional regulator [Streptosporangiales bacterium]
MTLQARVLHAVPDVEAPADSGAAPRDAARIRRRELGAFLRSRRERITPDQVSLPPGGRRRTPGLRREEVALLAGVGVTWYTWLEQGRDINVSEQVLDAVARTLLFDAHERAHLFTLAGTSPRSASSDDPDIYPTAQPVLDKLDPYPACVQNARYDVLAYNRGYEALFPEIATVPADERNCLWLSFTSQQWRERVVDWDYAVGRMVAMYRSAMAEFIAEPTWKCLVKRLRQASPEFVAVWERHEVTEPETRAKRFKLPGHGVLEFQHSVLWLDRRMGTRLTAYIPSDEQTRLTIDSLL